MTPELSMPLARHRGRTRFVKKVTRARTRHLRAPGKSVSRKREKDKPEQGSSHLAVCLLVESTALRPASAQINGLFRKLDVFRVLDPKSPNLG
jgi:hypothetical protein